MVINLTLWFVERFYSVKKIINDILLVIFKI
jgi:hypothetical protein